MDRRFRFRSCWSLLVGMIWFGLAAVAMAADAKQPEQPGSSEGGGLSWAPCYMIVILAIALGLMTVLSPSRRRERAKPEVYGDPK
jgi:hypothetical protein